MGLPGRAPYAASKAGIVGLTHTLGAEWAGRGVRVNAVLPGPVLTPMVADGIARGVLDEREITERTPAGRLGAPGDVGGAVLLLCLPAAGFITAQTLVVDGGYTMYGSAHGVVGDRLQGRGRIPKGRVNARALRTTLQPLGAAPAGRSARPGGRCPPPDAGGRRCARRARARVPHGLRLHLRRHRRPRVRHRPVRAARGPSRVDVGGRGRGALVLRARRARLLPHLRRRAADDLRHRPRAVHGGGHGGAVPLPSQADGDLRPSWSRVEPAGSPRGVRRALGRRHVHALGRGGDAAGDRLRRATHAPPEDRGHRWGSPACGSTTSSRTSGTT